MKNKSNFFLFIVILFSILVILIKQSNLLSLKYTRKNENEDCKSNNFKADNEKKNIKEEQANNFNINIKLNDYKQNIKKSFGEFETYMKNIYNSSQKKERANDSKKYLSTLIFSPDFTSDSINLPIVNDIDGKLSWEGKQENDALGFVKIKNMSDINNQKDLSNKRDNDIDAFNKKYDLQFPSEKNLNNGKRKTFKTKEISIQPYLESSGIKVNNKDIILPIITLEK